MLHPAKLAWGLAAACEGIGVRIAERTPATGLASDPDGVTVRTRDGVLRARRVALGTSAFPALVRRLRPFIVPVYDYVLVTDPLSPAQLAGDRLAEPAGRQRHGQPVPLLPADRATTGSCGAATTPSTTSAATSAGPTTSGRLRSSSSPRISSPRSRSWRASGSAIAGAARSTPAAGSARSSAPPTAAGSDTRSGTPGSGWRASRFGARVMLDLLSGEPTELTQLGWSGAGRCPSRPSRSPTWACRPRAGRWPGRTAGPAAGTYGSGRWTRRAWATTPEARRRAP